VVIGHFKLYPPVLIDHAAPYPTTTPLGNIQLSPYVWGKTFLMGGAGRGKSKLQFDPATDSALHPAGNTH